MFQPTVASHEYGLGSARVGAVECHSVLMVGTHLESMSGIRAVVKGYVEGGLFERFDSVYVPTHRTGSVWGKLWIASTAAVRLKRPLP